MRGTRYAFQILVRIGPLLLTIVGRFPFFWWGLRSTEVIKLAQVGASSAVLRAGYNLDCLMLRYGGVDWRDRTFANCNAGCAAAPAQSAPSTMASRVHTAIAHVTGCVRVCPLPIRCCCPTASSQHRIEHARGCGGQALKKQHKKPSADRASPRNA